MTPDSDRTSRQNRHESRDRDRPMLSGKGQAITPPVSTATSVSRERLQVPRTPLPPGSSLTHRLSRERTQRGQLDECNRECTSVLSDRPISAGSQVSVVCSDIEGNKEPICGEVFPDSAIPAHKDFIDDPAHKYWTWSKENMGWYHVDEDSKETIWAPNDFD